MFNLPSSTLFPFGAGLYSNKSQKCKKKSLPFKKSTTIETTHNREEFIASREFLWCHIDKFNSRIPEG